jgi:hypothetical protein
VKVIVEGGKMEAKDKFTLPLLNPVGVRRFEAQVAAKRLKDLNGKKIGLYWNHKARGDAALNRVKELLSERFEGTSFEWFETPIATEAKPDWFKNVKESGVDAVVASTGD